MTAYITKYALSAGILRRDVSPATTPGWVRYEENGATCFVARRWWHETWEAALAHAKTLKVAKLQALSKQYEHLAQVEWTEAK